MIADKYYALYRGIVKDNYDKENLGRCRVYVPAVHGTYDFSPDLLPWASPIASTVASRDRGSLFIPDEEDLVWVFFEGGDKQFPTYIGGSYTRDSIYVDRDHVVLYREGDDRIIYNRRTREILIQAPRIDMIGDVFINNISINEIGRVDYDIIKELQND